MLIEGDAPFWVPSAAGVWQIDMSVIKEQKSRLQDFDLTGREETPEGLICGGIVQVYIEPIVPTPVLYIYEEARTLKWGDHSRSSEFNASRRRVAGGGLNV